MDKNKFGLIIKFEDESDSFTNGFEAGLIASVLQRGETPINMVVHSENRKIIKRLCDYYGYRYQFKVSEVDGWVYWESYNIMPSPRKN